MKSMNEATCEINRDEMVEQMHRVIDFLQEAYQDQQPVHEVEGGLWERMLHLGRQLLGTFFALFGDGDEGRCWRLAMGER